ncbi:Panacea domain-containing protein [Mycoplasma leachii]|uniref:Panacea domain-containing protein n=1 Tax=Mycoplasma leachii TaxID=2105 RepID=UPI003DA60235
MRNKYSYKDISNWFLSKESMTFTKLEKLTYYAEAWSWALFDDGILNDTTFQAWPFAPASPELYEDYKNYNRYKIKERPFNDDLFDDDTINLLEAVWYTYGSKGGLELECISHSEEPWLKARNGLSEFEPSSKPIDPEDMKTYYRSIYNDN